MNARTRSDRQHQRSRTARIGARLAAVSLAGTLLLTALATLPAPVSAAAGSPVSGPERVKAAPTVPRPTRIGLWSAEPRSAAPSEARRLVRLNRASTKARVLKLNHAGMRKALATAPKEYTTAGEQAPLVVALPAPDGTTKRFAVTESPVMMPKLAAKHPTIKTYVGESLAGGSTIRITMSRLGFSASVRGTQGAWYLEPAEHLDKSAYLSYYFRDLNDTHGDYVEGEIGGHGGEGEGGGHGSDPASLRVGDPTVGPVGTQLRTYRAALVSDPSFAEYWDFESDPENVTIGKVLLLNRLNQVYEDSFSVRLLLANGTDKLNLNTTAQVTGTNGPCGALACYTGSQFTNCNNWDQSLIVAGLLIGADNFDIGHIMLGSGDGGVAQLGVVGFWNKFRGCTAIPNPGGDGYAVDYVAHEMGHQFDADHTWSGSTCGAGQFASSSAVEPGSGSTIMSYAGICGNNTDLQAYIDPYFSQRSYDQITSFIASSTTTYSEVQQTGFSGFGGTDSFRLRYNGNNSAVITNDSSCSPTTPPYCYTAAGIKAAIEGISGWPSGATVTVNAPAANPTGGNLSVSGSPNTNGFAVSFGGTLSNTNALPLQLQNVTGFTGVLGTIRNGGSSTNGGFTVTNTGNTPPSVSAPVSRTIPVRTPFALTASATDVNGDTLLYSWEQNDTTSSTIVFSTQPKTQGPIFRMFGTWGNPAERNAQQSPSGGQNALSTNPTRTFPDVVQIAAGNTNAETGSCAGVGLVLRECLSEWLPTASYFNPMNFRVTVNDGHPGGAGINSADVTISTTSAAGPFLVTSQGSSTTYTGKTDQTVAWDVANTTASPVSTANVKISLSTDGGLTYPHVLKASTPNDGSETVTITNIPTTKGRIKVEAVGNYFFDINNADFTINAVPRDPQTITFASLPDKTYGNPPFAINPTATSGLPVSVAAEGPCTVASNTVTITGGGTCTLTASQAGDGDWEPAPDVVRSFNIAKLSQTVTFGGLPNKTYGDPPFAINPTASSGLPVTITPEGPCSVTNKVVTLTGAGTCTLTASQPGSAGYNPATSVVRSFSIAKRKTTATLKVKPTKALIGAPVTFTTTVKATGGSLNPTGTVTLFAGTTQIGSGSVDGQGVSVITTPLFLPQKTHQVKATYTDPADGFITSSSKLVKLKVSKPKTTTKLQIQPKKVKQGQSATFTTTVKAKGKGVPPPSGTVTLTIGTTVIGSGSLNPQGKLILTMTVNLAIKTHQVKATYVNPEGYYVNSKSKLVKLQVIKP